MKPSPKLLASSLLASSLLVPIAALFAEPLTAAPLARAGVMRSPVMHLRGAHSPVAVMAPLRAQRRVGFGRGGAGYAYGGPYFDGAFAPPAPVSVESEEPAVIYAEPAVAAACIRPRVIELRKRQATQLPKVFYGTPLDCPRSGA